MSFVSAPRDIFSRKLYDKYIAEVVDNNDPKQLGRIRVKILELHGTKIPNDKLPWASPIYPSGHGSKSGYGSLVLPEVGSRVFVELYKGDIYSLFYVGAPREFNRQVSSQLLANYPYNYGYQDPKGNRLRINLQDNSVEITLANGTVVNINTDGNISLTTPGTVTTNTGDQDHTASQFTFNGPVQINGTLNVSDNITGAAEVADLDGTMTEMRTTYNSHTHGGVDSGSSNTNSPNQGMT